MARLHRLRHHRSHPLPPPPALPLNQLSREELERIVVLQQQQQVMAQQVMPQQQQSSSSSPEPLCPPPGPQCLRVVSETWSFARIVLPRPLLRTQRNCFTMVQASTYGKAIVFTCTVGIALCVYAFVVEERKSQDAKYQAVCDLSEHMSCSRVLTSPYAKGFGLVRHVLGEDSPLNVPNSIPGGVMFTLFALLCFLQRAWTARIQLVLGILSNISSIYLGSILYFVLQDFCVICVSVYAINFINLVLAFLRLRALTSKPVGKQKGQQKSQKGQKGGKQQQNEKQKSPQAEKKKEKQKSPQAEKQKQNQQNGKVKNQQNDKQKSPKTPNSKKKN